MTGTFFKLSYTTLFRSYCYSVVNLLCEEGASVNEGTLLAEVVAADAKEK